MKTCASCGQASEDEAKFCNSCGAPFEENSVSAAQSEIPAAPKAATKKDFLKLPENKKVLSELRGAGIICYVCAGITLAVGAATGSFPWLLIDVAILVGLGLGIHLKYSRVCAILLGCYAAFNTISALIQSGTFSGYLVLIAAIFAIIYTFKAEKLWKAYQQ